MNCKGKDRKGPWFRYSVPKFISVVFLIVLVSAGKADDPPFYSIDENGRKWVDSVLAALTPEQKIGQLFMVAAYSDRDRSHADSINDLICNYHIGGVIFFQGGPVRQAYLTNEFQAKAPIPLLISIDGEWGLAMRLDSTMRFPRQMTIGGIANNQLIYEMGTEIARQCRRIGIHVNFAPVVDINNNPLNPVISNRSFGEEKANVAEKGLAYMAGMQENGVLASAKHFPGHGDTDADSHLSLPVIKRSRAGLDSLELVPFKWLISRGLGSMMVAHLYIPSIDSSRNLASTLSKPVVTQLLKNDLAFKGLVFTDALNMRGVSSYHQPGMVEIKALQSGNDVLLFSEDVPRAAREIRAAISSGQLSMGDIEDRVRKILAVKYWSGAATFPFVNPFHIQEDLHRPDAVWLNRQLHESSLTLLINKNDLIPFQRLDTLRIASLTLNDSLNNYFQNTLDLYAPVDHYALGKSPSESEIAQMMKKLEPYNLVIVGIYNTRISPLSNYGITEQMIKVINLLNQRTSVVLDVFGNPYTLSRIIGVEDVQALLMSYEGSEISQELSAQLLFGGIPAKGKLAVTASTAFRMGAGLSTGISRRLKYTVPEEVGVSSHSLARIDSIALDAIEKGATPGCQVLVAKDGKVIYYKSFGHHSYDLRTPVRNTDLYDVASITKVAGTALAMMNLYDRHKINLDKKISRYLPELRGCDKKDIVLREMLAHQAGLQAWIPYFEKTLVNGKLAAAVYRKTPDTLYSVRVAENIYMRSDYRDSMWQEVIASPLKPAGRYVYSDLGMIVAQKIIERLSRERLDSFVISNFYRSLGLSTLCFNPRERFPLRRIVPTEKDLRFRNQLVHGDVHDPWAAMNGGVSGHAGIFASANDLAIIMQMLLQKGEYARERYIKAETISEFTSQQFTENENRRGLIFDKPEVDISKNGPTARSAPHTTFGHTGFTGTCVWVDPDNNLIYIFLSNRVHPDAANNKLVNMNIRTEIQQVIYDAIRKSRSLPFLEAEVSQ